ncbi:MAG: mannose-1-phosphate guanylyltransferase/mannose-6-phosphate isomerase [Hyphomicrobiaceae bacterium]
MQRTIHPVVLVGGRGTRLWPMSRASLPKVFQKLASDKSLLQETCVRLGGVADVAAPLVVCNKEHVFLVREQLAGTRNLTILAEPVRRNTGPAIAAAAAWIQKRDPEAIMLVLPADHVITNVSAFRRAIEKAVEIAKKGQLVTFGIEPDGPETEYGYIQAGKAIEGNTEGSRIARFVEKPNRPKAETMLSEGGYFWNSGMFVFPVRDVLDELRSYAPEVLRAAVASVPLDSSEDGLVHLDEAEFPNAPSISIDYAVMEKTSRAAVLPCSIGWSDVGNWNALWDLGEKDGSGNVNVGDTFSQDTSNTYLRSDGPLVVGVGLENIVVVASDDAVLVGDRAHIRSVNQAVDTLSAQQRKEADSHNRCYRPWGFYETLQLGPRFQVKRICVNPGSKLSLQKHFHRAEHWVVVEGSAMVTRDDEEILLSENESIYLPLGCVHRLENPGNVMMTLIEVQYGSYLGEDDIVRLEDVYGRV